MEGTPYLLSVFVKKELIKVVLRLEATNKKAPAKNLYGRAIHLAMVDMATVPLASLADEEQS